jgi:osmotically inducible protein OsmC
MPVRKANAVWEGNLKEGQGKIALGSGAFEGPYSFGSRFEEAKGTNPEELIGAAHAGCYAMALAFALQGAGFTPDSLEVTATINFDVSGTPTITQSALVLKAKIPGITDDKFQELAKGAKEGCPVSRVLKAEVTLDAKLV